MLGFCTSVTQSSFKKAYWCVLFSIIFFVGCGHWGAPALMPPIESGLHYTPPEPQKWVLPNGMTVLYLEDSELPLVRGALYVRKGSFWESDQDFAAYELMGSMLRKGGAGGRTADELDNRLEELAASVDSSMSGQYGSLSFQCLEDDIDEVFGLFSDVVLRPRFQADRLKLLVGQVLEGIARRKDDPWTIAALAFKSVIYGKAPLGRVLTSSLVKRVRPFHLRKAYLKFLNPERAILAISGRISRAKLEELLAKEFVHLKPSQEEFPELQPEFPRKAARIVYVPSDLAQATLLVGHLGVPLYTQDHFPILVYNEIFSGGMSSLLFKRIRSEQGLAYSVYGAISPGFLAGQNIVAMQTKAESAGQAMLSAIQTIGLTQREAVEAMLLEEKRRGMSASYVFSHATPWAILNRKVSLEIAGYPKNYDSIYLDKLAEVTSEDVRTVASNRWEQDKLVLVLVGDQQAYESFLKVKESLPAEYASLPIERGSFKENFSF
jgi:zinc protease